MGRGASQTQEAWHSFFFQMCLEHRIRSQALPCCLAMVMELQTPPLSRSQNGRHTHVIRAGRGFARIVGSVGQAAVSGQGQGYVLVFPESDFCDQPGIPPLVFHSFGVSVYVSLGSVCQPVPHACERGDEGLLCSHQKGDGVGLRKPDRMNEGINE